MDESRCTDESSASSTAPGKVVFLDVDGVLHEKGSKYKFKKDCCNILVHVLHRTNASVVLSSCWRRSQEGVSAVNRMLQRLNALPIYDTTRDFSKEGSRKDMLTLSLTRVQEICEWLDRHPSVDRWVAIDDLELNFASIQATPGIARYAARMSGHFIRTDKDVGMTKDLGDHAISLLGDEVSLEESPKAEVSLGWNQRNRSLSPPPFALGAPMLQIGSPRSVSPIRAPSLGPTASAAQPAWPYPSPQPLQHWPLSHVYFPASQPIGWPVSQVSRAQLSPRTRTGIVSGFDNCVGPTSSLPTTGLQGIAVDRTTSGSKTTPRLSSRCRSGTETPVSVAPPRNAQGAAFNMSATGVSPPTLHRTGDMTPVNVSPLAPTTVSSSKPVQGEMGRTFTAGNSPPRIGFFGSDTLVNCATASDMTTPTWKRSTTLAETSRGRNLERPALMVRQPVVDSQLHVAPPARSGSCSPSLASRLPSDFVRSSLQGSSHLPLQASPHESLRAVRSTQPIIEAPLRRSQSPRLRGSAGASPHAESWPSQPPKVSALSLTSIGRESAWSWRGGNPQDGSLWKMRADQPPTWWGCVDSGRRDKLQTDSLIEEVAERGVLRRSIGSK